MQRKTAKGRYTPKNPKKYLGDVSNIIFRSSWEHKMFRYCDLSSTVIQWNSEECVVPYVNPLDGEVHRYFVDIYMLKQMPDGTTKKFLVEIKPKYQTKEPKKQSKKTKRYLTEVTTWITNKAKWEAATEYAKKNGMNFQILTEDELKIK